VKRNNQPENARTVHAPQSAERKRLGQVSAEERDEIRALFERKNGLLELSKSLGGSDAPSDALYERVVTDLGKATTRFNDWWSSMRAKYQWENVPGAQWEIDFEDCSIYLVRQ